MITFKRIYKGRHSPEGTTTWHVGVEQFVPEVINRRPYDSVAPHSFINLLATDFLFQILAHPVFKM